MNIWDKKPDHINELGIKWWLDKQLMKYVKELDIPLETMIYFVLYPNGYKTRVIIQEKNVVYEDTDIAAIATRIDMQKLFIEFTNGEEI